MAGRMRGIALLASALLAGMASSGFEALGCPGDKKHKG
jgi:hypothetical protein